MESQPAPEEIIDDSVVEEQPPVEMEAEGGETPPVEEAPAYEPNFMFKVHGQEKEFDEWARPLVKDEESEKMFREIMEKVHGIDYIKEDRENLRAQNEELTQVQEQYNYLSQQLGTLDKFIANKNFDAFFQKTRISEDDVLKWAAKRLQYYEMSPEQRAEYDRSVQAQTNEIYMGEHAQTLEQKMHELEYKQTQFQIDQQLSQPGVADFVAEYDGRLGQGAFRKAVEERGLFHYYQSGKDVPVEQAVQEVMQIAGMQVQAQSPAPMAPTQPGPQTPTAPPQAQSKPVIPKVGGSGTSPVKAGVRSIEDLKKLAAARS